MRWQRFLHFVCLWSESTKLLGDGMSVSLYIYAKTNVGILGTPLGGSEHIGTMTRSGSKARRIDTYGVTLFFNIRISTSALKLNLSASYIRILYPHRRHIHTSPTDICLGSCHGV